MNFDDEKLAALNERSAKGMSGGFYPDDAYGVFEDLLADLISLRGRLRTLASSLEKDSRNLRGDTLTSMSEGMCNEAVADRLDRLVLDLQQIIKG